MSDWDIAEPRADALIESLRAFGYTPEAAIADLVDNSISAGAKTIRVDLQWNGRDSVVTVADDGSGMSEAALYSAMRPGSRSPLEDRSRHDLGRFGLGLKTASFSQARELTVLTRTVGFGDAIRRWDLDTVAASGEWRLLRSGPPAIDLNFDGAAGTVVAWSKCDRLVGDVDSSDTKAHERFLQLTARIRHHLEATFHRFLGGRGRVLMLVNGQALRPWDPFMTSHGATQHLFTEDLPFQGEIVRVKAYVLPHRSKLTPEQADEGHGASGWNQQQGFYLYRSNRLLVQGDWLNLGFTKDEHTKLARVSVDFPATLDHAWQVDVKKSSARTPGALVPELKRIAKVARSRAEEVYRFRGKITASKTSQPFVVAWLQYIDRAGDIRYKVNRSHPVIVALLDAAAHRKGEVEKALRFIEETVPTTLIGVSIADSLDKQPTPFGDATRDLKPLIDFVFTDLVVDGYTPDEALDRIAVIEPFSQFPQVVQAFRESMQ
ncbi:ATP-binding protein [Nocardioides sp. YJ-D4]